ncbi:MAG: NAD(P)/FAD-dependent oxidoreductase [Saprospiraceae bacterium]|nr:NAD(P)/FAD-dependent oxidoreductase [Saprospiraceae bacterium]MCB9322184.1 NAD(P)/FAD-dependent oxidoreductase [Lewinellaceae bacterium]
MMAHHEVVVVGGGSAGLAVAAQLLNQKHAPEVAIIDPSEKHYYQPIWTLVGGGVFPKEISERDQKDYIPLGATWIKDKVASFDPDHNSIQLAGGDSVTYDYLVVAAGIQINWGAIPGLKESVGKPGTGVCSNYSYDTVGSTWDNIKAIKSGTALFTQPNTPIKCGGAPQKIMYLACNHFEREGIRPNVDVKFMSAAGGIFAVPKYAAALNKVVANYGIETHYGHDLVEIRADKKEADFVKLATGEKMTMKYDMIHVTPPQGPPDFIKNSPLAAETGWVNVDKHTTQHVKYPNVFSLGDCSSLPTSKTGAAIRKQAPTTTANIMSMIAGRPLSASYDGYTSCPLVTGYGKLILAEFSGYTNEPEESFPFNQAEERYSMYALKAYGLPRMYWHGMLKGREF